MDALPYNIITVAYHHSSIVDLRAFGLPYSGWLSFPLDDEKITYTNDKAINCQDLAKSSSHPI
jgi:hypothetical protein